MTTAAPQPPGPQLPARVQDLALQFAPERFTAACRRRYGDVVTFRTELRPVFVMVFDPELVKQFLQGLPDQVRAEEAFRLGREVLGRTAVSNVEAAEHMYRRRQLTPHLHGERMRAQAGVIRDAVDREIDSWPTGKPFALYPSMLKLTSEVIVRMALGLEEGPRRDELVALLLARGQLAPRLRLWRRSEPTLGDRAPLEQFLREEIARQGTRADSAEDVLSMLRLERDKDGQPIGEEELCDQLITFLLAASETTSSGLAWAFDLLLRNPAALERLEAELADGSEDYLRAVVKETLRLRPPVPYLDRVVTEEPYALGGYALLPGTHIRAAVASVHHRADLYPDPLAFRPERFLGEDKVDDSMWLPFGAGVRRCLGASFAPFEIRTVIRRVLERTRLEPAGRRAEKAAPLGFTLAPARGTRVIKEPGLRWV